MMSPMMINQLSLYRIEIPFKLSFSHHSASREATESIWVEVETGNGQRGVGEGCPRAYVSGENLASAEACFRAWRPELMQLTSLAELQAWVTAHRAEIDARPAAWCAIELALLDALAREAGLSVEALLGLPELAGEYVYSAVLGDSSPESFSRQLGQYLALGFRDFKLKLAGDPGADAVRLQALKAAGVRIRVDANNLWAEREQAIAYFRALETPLFAIEEPLSPARRFADLASLAEALDTPVIADESCLNLNDLAHLSPECFIVNLRVSKMGGLLRSLELVEAAKARGIGLIIGAQVGETSLLTRAALSLVSPAAPLAQEGAFGTHLLSADLVEPPLMFGKAGLLKAPAEARPGFGLEIAPDSGLLIQIA